MNGLYLDSTCTYLGRQFELLLCFRVFASDIGNCSNVSIDNTYYTKRSSEAITVFYSSNADFTLEIARLQYHLSISSSHYFK